MPLEYTLEKDGALVVASARGRLSLDCFMSLLRQMKADPNLKHPYDALLDLTLVSGYQITEQELAVFARELTRGPKKLGAQRLAIVTIEQRGFELSGEYEKIVKGITQSVIIFYHPGVARTWLGA